MKYILIGLIALLACSKSNQNVGGNVCWTCHFGNVNGVLIPDTVICTDGSDPKPRTTDGQGNDYGYNCQKNR